MIRTALLALALALGGGAFHFGLLDGVTSVSSGTAAKAGNHMDPNGAPINSEAGGNLDPDGAAAAGDAGTNLHPNG